LKPGELIAKMRQSLLFIFGNLDAKICGSNKLNKFLKTRRMSAY